MTTRHTYMALCLIGLIIPNAAFWPWLLDHGVDPAAFVRDLFVNGVAGFFGLDVILSAVALTVFVQIEGRRIALRRRWIPIAAAWLVGVSFGLPLFLYQRQVHFERAAA